MLSKRLIPLAFALLLPLTLLSQEPQALNLTGQYAGTHDPSIARDGATYYVFATGFAPGGGQFAVRCSTDLIDWKLCGHVFDQIPAWIHEDSPSTKELWAPDISYFAGKYHLYYAYSSFGSNMSGIALATNETLDPKSPKYRWNDEGLVLKSLKSDDFNAIDPNIVFDEKHQPWMSFGSFWGGIKMRRIDAVTGKLSAADTTLYSLAKRTTPANPEPPQPGLPPDWQAIEAPFVVHHGGYYYLFVSFDLCCRGTRSNYREMVGRASLVTGPYVDAQGKPMMEGGATQLLFPTSRWMGPGGASILQRPEGDIIVYHVYDGGTGKPALQISTITWKDGWPHATVGTAGEAK
jgi:arabinan endo-1,5-alpha-L-arabinosidase